MLRSAEEILGKEAIAAVRRPIGQARGLPAIAYHSEEFFRLEQQKLFRRTWMGVGFTCDVPNPGDAIPIMAAGLPFILVRTAAGVIKAFHNICRHRGAMMLTAPCKKLRQFQCPYHAWTYDLDGKLKVAPYFDGTKSGLRDVGFDPAELGLIEVRCGVWHHWIFLNLDGNAPPIEEHMQPLVEQMNGADLGATRIAERVDWEFEANWKLMNENWENYHHMWAHYPIFSKVADDLDFKTREPWSKSVQQGAVMCIRRSSVSAPPYPNRKSTLPMIPFPDGAERVTSPNLVLPNVEITVVRDNIGSLITDPIAPTRTLARMAFFFVGDAADSAEHAEGRKLNLDRWLGPSRSPTARDGLRNQDFRIWETQQIARRSPAADAPVFSPTWEANVHYFQNQLLDYLTA